MLTWVIYRPVECDVSLKQQVRWTVLQNRNNTLAYSPGIGKLDNNVRLLVF